MNLIAVLIALGLEALFGSFDKYRDLAWFERYARWLEEKLANKSVWDGSAGALAVTLLPLAPLALLVFLLGEVHFVLTFLVSLPILIYSLGPAVNQVVNDYIEALAAGDEQAARAAAEQLMPDVRDEQVPSGRLLGAVMLRAHERLFAVIFWFFVLGAVGALLYCLTANLAAHHRTGQSDYAAAVRRLHSLLMWPSARLLALGFALGGSMVNALESWRSTPDNNTLALSPAVVEAAGLGALQHELQAEQASATDNKRLFSHLEETLALINRTLIVWLIGASLMTIAGFIS